MQTQPDADGSLAPVVRVRRSKRQAAASYDRMAKHYDRFAWRYDRPFVVRGLTALEVRSGERALEIGYGTGGALELLARAVGPDGRVTGIDISRGMRDVALQRLRRRGLESRIELLVGDVASTDLGEAAFDCAFMSFTLELFDTPEIPVVLEQVRRALEPGGRLGVVAMQRQDPPGLMERLYLWSHRRFPAWVDCRPIPVADLLRDAGFEIRSDRRMSMWGLPVAAVVAGRV